MICINNVVSVSATTGAAGEEGRIIAVNLVPVAVYVTLVLAVAFVVIY